MTWDHLNYVFTLLAAAAIVFGAIRRKPVTLTAIFACVALVFLRAFGDTRRGLLMEAIACCPLVLLASLVGVVSLRKSHLRPDAG